MKQTRRQFLYTGLCTAGLAVPALQPLAAAPARPSANAACSPLLDHALRPLMGAQEVRLCDAYAGNVVLIVNTASQCGFVGQFEGLETLHRQYKDKGLSVLGFPSDDFRQEFDDEADVAEFCELNYGVTFPMFQKVNVRGGDVHPLYAGLAAAAGDAPGWNFYKYLIDRNGEMQRLYGSVDEPLGSDITGAIERLLQE